MAKNINKDAVYKAAKPKESDYMINDGGGLFLFVAKTGVKSWRFVYTFNKKEINWHLVFIQMSHSKQRDAKQKKLMRI